MDLPEFSEGLGDRFDYYEHMTHFCRRAEKVLQIEYIYKFSCEVFRITAITIKTNILDSRSYYR